MSTPAKIVREQQRAWATNYVIAIDFAGYTIELNDNLFVPLSNATRTDFLKADGTELKSDRKRSKMHALHSSSALASNVFEYWRNREKSILASSLNLYANIKDNSFEWKFPTGLPGNPPNLDVILTLTDGSITAIESKFLEPYGRHKQGFKTKYFESSPGLWAAFGYPHCQNLASQLQSGDFVFQWLHAEQLLKHILGLARSGKVWELLYLWYEVPGRSSRDHAAEGEEFASVVTVDGISFRSISYQTLFTTMQSLAKNSDDAYLGCLQDRYFRQTDL